MKNFIAVSVAFAGLSLAGAAQGYTQTTYSCTDSAGVSTLTNVPTPGAQCEALYTSEVADAAPVAATPVSASGENKPSPTATSARTAVSEKVASPAKSPETDAKAATARKLAKAMAARAASDRRDNAVQETADAYARGTPKDGNPAVTRRYLKTDRATYIQQNGVVPK